MPTPEQRRFDEAIPVVLLCLQHCEQCAAHCTDQGSKALSRCIKLSHACAESCIFCMRVLSSWLPEAKSACRICADFCDACEAECREIQDDIVQSCADACAECSKVCRSVAAL